MKLKLSELLKHSILAICLCVPPLAMAEENMIIIMATDGSTAEYPIGLVERIELGTDNATVVAAGGVSTLNYADIDRILIGAEPLGIAAAETEGSIAVWPKSVTSTLNVAGATAGTPVKVFTAAGVLAASATADGATLSLDLSAAPTGVCIVTIGDQSVKIIKK